MVMTMAPMHTDDKTSQSEKWMGSGNYKYPRIWRIQNMLFGDILWFEIMR